MAKRKAAKKGKTKRRKQRYRVVEGKRVFSREFRRFFVLVIATAFIITAALLWAEALKSIIETFIIPSKVWTYQLIAAILVTVVAAVAVYFLARYVSWSAVERAGIKLEK